MSDKSLSVEKRIDAWRQFQQAMQPPRAALTQIEVDDIRELLENVRANAPELRRFFTSRRLEEKYPIGFVLFYTDAARTLRYDVKESGIDLSTWKRLIPLSQGAPYDV
jgi:hypothetical protein